MQIESLCTIGSTQPTPHPARRGGVHRALPHAGKHALIIEDNALNAEVLETLLGKYGLTATTVESPGNLADLLASLDRLDAIFLDLELVETTGFEVYHRLQQIPQAARVPVVAYTVHLSQLERARREGFDGFLGKPLKQEWFEDQLNRILSGLPVWDA
jgi:two-component system, cell cycle response regulator DivK